MSVGLALLAWLVAPAPVPRDIADFTCTQQGDKPGVTLLSHAGFSRVTLHVRLTLGREAQPMLWIQQGTGEPRHWQSFILSVPVEAMPDTPFPAIFRTRIEMSGADEVVTASAEGRPLFGKEFDWTIVREPSGAVRMTVLEASPGAKPVEVLLEAADFPEGPLVLLCDGGTYEISNMTVE